MLQPIVKCNFVVTTVPQRRGVLLLDVAMGWSSLPGRNAVTRER